MTIEQIDKMKDNEAVNWWIITGNHDSLDAEILWEKFKNKSKFARNASIIMAAKIKIEP